MRCRICGGYADGEHPDTVWELNPQTFYRAILHAFCLGIAIDDLSPSRLDKYNERIQGV